MCIGQDIMQVFKSLKFKYLYELIYFQMFVFVVKILNIRIMNKIENSLKVFLGNVVFVIISYNNIFYFKEIISFFFDNIVCYIYFIKMYMY